jgi:hypothetical protein
VSRHNHPTLIAVLIAALASGACVGTANAADSVGAAKDPPRPAPASDPAPAADPAPAPPASPGPGDGQPPGDQQCGPVVLSSTLPTVLTCGPITINVTFNTVTTTTTTTIVSAPITAANGPITTNTSNDTSNQTPVVRCKRPHTTKRKAATKTPSHHKKARTTKAKRSARRADVELNPIKGRHAVKIRVFLEPGPSR